MLENVYVHCMYDTVHYLHRMNESKLEKKLQKIDEVCW